MFGGPWSVLNPNCTCYSTGDAVRIGNSFIYNPNHTSLQSLTIIYYAAARLHNYNRYTFVTTVTYYTLARRHSLRALHSNLYCTIAHKVSYYNHLVDSCTGWLLSYQLLCRIITLFPASHFPCLSPIETSIVGLLLTNCSRELNWLVKVTLRLTVSQSVSLDQIFITVWQLRSCFCGAPSLARGWFCLLYMLLALASAVFLGSESLGTQDHILLSLIWDFPFRRLLRLARSWWRYSTLPPHHWNLLYL
jgi:hypothetical protein